MNGATARSTRASWARNHGVTGGSMRPSGPRIRTWTSGVWATTCAAVAKYQWTPSGRRLVGTPTKQPVPIGTTSVDPPAVRRAQRKATVLYQPARRSCLKGWEGSVVPRGMTGRPLRITWHDGDDARTLWQKYRAARDPTVRVRLHLLWRVRAGDPVKVAAATVGVSPRAAVHWLARYRQAGLAPLCTTGRGPGR